MKRKINSIVTLFLTVMLFLCFFACQKKEFDVETAAVSYDETEKVLVLDLTNANVTEYSLQEVMQDLQSAKKFTFIEENGMIFSINGVENPVDWSYCWMLYPSDEEVSTAEYGTFTYQGKTYNQAAFGAADLKVKSGEIYLWWYQGF